MRSLSLKSEWWSSYNDVGNRQNWRYETSQSEKGYLTGNQYTQFFATSQDSENNFCSCIGPDALTRESACSAQHEVVCEKRLK